MPHDGCVLSMHAELVGKKETAIRDFAEFEELRCGIRVVGLSLESVTAK